MSYNKITSFAVKDTMIDSNPLKIIRGKEFDDEFDAITTAMEAQDGVISNLVTTPVGGVVMYTVPVAPQGFLLCDGASRSRNTYAALFQVIGTTFGAGDGVTTFNVPNFNGRFPYGGPVGQLGGSADSIVPAHTHTATVAINDPGHSHTVENTRPYGNYGAGGTIELHTSNATRGTTSSVSTGITATSTVASAGVLATNGNLPPFVSLSFLIKT